MFSVTQRIQNIRQPYNGYISPHQFAESTIDDDDVNILPLDSAVKAIQGLAVDYLTRFMIGCPKEEAFSISLKGADIVSELDKAKQLLHNITGLDDNSIKNSCRLVRYDTAYRRGAGTYVESNDTVMSNSLIHNIRHLVNRCCAFLGKNGPVVMNGFTFEGGYNNIVSSGDGDFITNTTLWDLKVSEQSLNKDWTLQIFMYYIMGIHSIHSAFRQIKYLGIYNALQNKSYQIKISDVDSSVFANICREVIGYNTPDDDDKWPLSNGTNEELLTSIAKKAFYNLLVDTGFRPEKFEDGIYDISIDDYWSFYKTIDGASFYRPELYWTESIKFLKNKGFYMFVSVSYKGKLSVMNRGQIKNIKRPLEYYYERIPEYAEIVLKSFSPYWKALHTISTQIKSIEPDKNTVKKSKYGEYKRFCMKHGLPIQNFEQWYEKRKETFRLDGTVHGCIVDLDYSSHIFLNPYDGQVVPYSAPSMYEKYVYENVASLIADKRPEMLTGFQTKYSNETEPLLLNDSEVETNAVIPISKESNQSVIRLASKNDRISKKTDLVTSTDIYKISNRLKALQMIFDHKVIVDWYDDILPHLEIEGEIQPQNKSIASQSARMHCGMIATVIADYGSRNITVQFEDGTIVENVSRQQFKKQNIMNPTIRKQRAEAKRQAEWEREQKIIEIIGKKERIVKKKEKKQNKSYLGKTERMNCGLYATVIQDNGCNDITIQFEDGLVREHCRRDKFREGKIAHKS